MSFHFLNTHVGTRKKHHDHTLLEEKVLYRTFKGSISATYLEPLKGSINSIKGSSGFYIEPWGSILGQ